MKTVFVAWQDPESRQWIPVGKLMREGDKYTFVYTRGAQESKHFLPFGRMTDLTAVYESKELFPLFANRVLPKSRPEYRDYVRWLGFDAQAPHELDLLARSGGERATDSLEIFPCPEPTSDNRYEMLFFAHGSRYLSRDQQDRIKVLMPGERLFLLRDVQNPVDKTALLLRTADPISVVGYCPRYHSMEFSLLLDRSGVQTISVSVVQVNADAPAQLRLMCKFEAPWPLGFSPCSREAYQPLPERVAVG